MASAHEPKEITPLMQKRNSEVSFADFGTAEPASNKSTGLLRKGSSFFAEGTQTELSFEEMRSSMLEGCCPGDSIASGALSLLTAAVTPTMLSLPLAFSVGGLHFALVSVILCVLMTLASVRILAFASASAQSDDYETVSGFFFGSACKWATRMVLFFYNFGCSVVYLRFIYDSLDPVLTASAHWIPPWLAGSSGPVIALCLFVVCATPLSFNSRLASLRTNGFISNVLVTFIVGAIIYRYFVPLDKTVVPDLTPPTTQLLSITASGWKWLLPYFFAGPMFVFAYEVQSNVMSVFRDLYDPTPTRITICVCLALTGTTLFYIPLGVFGSRAFPDSVSGNILKNYDLARDPMMLIAQLCCCFSAAVAFVFVLFPCRFAFFMLISDGSTHKVPHRFRVRIGIMLSAISCFLALFVPDVAMAVSVLGACCSATLSMTLPALFSMEMRRSGTYCTSWLDAVTSWLMLGGGLCFTVIGTFMGFYASM